MGQRLDELLQRCTVKLSVPGKLGHGTGFFVAPGLILTCAHVVKAAGFEPVKVSWQNQDNFAEAVTERFFPDPFDLALLRFSSKVADLPCVYLDEDIQPDDSLYTYGYPDDFPKGAPITGLCEGLTGGDPPLIKFKAGQVRPGLSGSPLLNQRTGKVCGIVKFTRDRGIDLGGGAIPTTTIFSQLPELADQNCKFHLIRERVSKAKELASIRMTMLTAKSNWELQSAFYEVEEFLSRHPHDIEGRLLKDRVLTAIQFQKSEAESLGGAPPRYTRSPRMPLLLALRNLLVVGGLVYLLYVFIQWILEILK